MRRDNSNDTFDIDSYGRYLNGSDYDSDSDIEKGSFNEIEIDFTDKFLTISGTRSHNNIDKIANIHQDVDYGEFHRTLDLSKYHLKDDISAEYDNGILELVFSLSKVKHRNVRKIKIK